MNTSQEHEQFEGLEDLVQAEENSNEPRVYELGYHILSSLSENELEAETQNLHQVFAKLGGELVGERKGVLVHLAYPIDKKVDEKRQMFTSAYFGWMAYNLKPSDIQDVHEALESNQHVLRFILTKTTREQVEALLVDPSLDVIGALQEEEQVEMVGADTDTDVDVPQVEDEKETA